MRGLLGWFFGFAQLWRSPKFEVPLNTSEERLICDLWRAVNIMILGEDFEIGDCAENGRYENFVFLARAIICGALT